MTAAGQLTEAHRLAQLQVGAVTVRQMMNVFDLLDPEDLDGTFADWVSVVAPIVQANRTQSARLAGRYLAAFRTLKIGDGDPFAPVLADELNLDALTRSMLVTGPISIRANLGRMPLARAVDIALERTASAAMRVALNGGRETITTTVQADKRAVGYQRITSGNACEFCSMLADRGAVYGEASVDFEAHDRCGCTGEPVYR